MEFNWQLIETGINGRTLYKDRDSCIHAICPVGGEPDDATAYLMGVTPETREWFAQRWEFLSTEEA